MRARPCAAAALALLVAGCGGGSDGDTTAPRSGPTAAARCARLPTGAIEKLVAKAGGGRPPTLHASATGSSALLACRYLAPGARIHVNLDTAPRSRTRYRNRMVELAQFSGETKGTLPRPVRGLGDNIDGGGANWEPATNQLYTVKGRRYFIIDFYARGASDTQLRRAAVSLARLAIATLDRD